MSIENLRLELEAEFPRASILYNEMMKNHTSFRVGGPAEIVFLPENIDELKKMLLLCKKNEVNFYVMGNGSNLIVRDGGYRGAIIKLTRLDYIGVEGNCLTAGAGALLSLTSKEALKNELKGMEFSSGIPGSVGGAVTMNAGAYGPEIKDVISSAKLMDCEGNIFSLVNSELELGYRESIVHKKNLIVLEASFILEKGNYNEIKNRMDELNKRRADKQPLSYPSAGSTFKRPEGHFAGKLIEDAGLKGMTIGGAMVSEKHAGFVINYKDASASDVIRLINQVQKIIYKTYDVKLEPEVKIIGED